MFGCLHDLASWQFLEAFFESTFGSTTAHANSAISGEKKYFDQIVLVLWDFHALCEIPVSQDTYAQLRKP